MPNQQTLPTLEALPEYDGQRPIGMRTSLNGTGNRITHPHRIGDTVIVVLECRVTESAHKEVDDGIVYFEALKTKDFIEVPGSQGKTLLNALRQAAAGDEGTLPGVVATEVKAGAKVVADASGVVATPTEAETVFGIPHDPALDPVVLVFDDGSRGLWPDDWAGLGQSRAEVGGFMRAPGSTKAGDVLQLRKVLDADSGATLAEWTEEQEDARLLAAERQALAEEQTRGAEDTRADLDATAELEAARGRTLDYDAPAEVVDTADPTHISEVIPEVVAGLKTTEAVVGRLREVLGLVLGEPLAEDADPLGTAVELADVDLDHLPPEVAQRLLDHQDELVALVDAADPFQVGPPSTGPDDELELDDDAIELVPDEAIAPLLRLVEDYPAPLPEDYAFVDRKEVEIREALDAAELTHADLLRLIAAEEAGRGRGLKPRKGVLDLLERKAREVYLAAPVAVPDLPVEAFDVTDEAAAADAEV